MEKELEELKKIISLENDSDLVLLEEIKETRKELSEKIENDLVDGLVTVTNEIKADMAEVKSAISQEIKDIPQSKDYSDKLETILSKLDEPLEIKLNII